MRINLSRLSLVTWWVDSLERSRLICLRISCNWIIVAAIFHGLRRHVTLGQSESSISASPSQLSLWRIEVISPTVISITHEHPEPRNNMFAEMR
jgi:hypothetical protein